METDAGTLIVSSTESVSIAAVYRGQLLGGAGRSARSVRTGAEFGPLHNECSQTPGNIRIVPKLQARRINKLLVRVQREAPKGCDRRPVHAAGRQSCR